MARVVRPEDPRPHLSTSTISFMNDPAWTIRELRAALAAGTVRPSQLAQTALARANQNAGRNTYLWQDAAWTLAAAARAEAMPRGSGGPFGDGRSALWGLPVAVKDCFDLAGSPTSCGVRFYRDLNGTAARDSWLVEQLRAAGAVIVGKTHLHRAGLRNHRRESRIRRLRAASRCKRAHRRLVQRRCCQRAGGFCRSRHRH